MSFHPGGMPWFISLMRMRKRRGMKLPIWSDYYPIPSPSAQPFQLQASALSYVLLQWRQRPGDINMYGNVVSFSRQCMPGFRSNGHHARAAAFRAHEIVSRHPDVCRPCRLDFIVVIWKASKIVQPFLIVLCYNECLLVV